MTKFNVISREVKNGTFPAHSDKALCCSAFGKTMIINMYSFKRMLNKTAKENTKATL